MNAKRIEGAVAMVTGANRGIGRALTEALLARGVKKVYATARDPETLRELLGERLVALRLDVTEPPQTRRRTSISSSATPASCLPQASRMQRSSSTRGARWK
jgi:NAD(P)-dependent dehydrogenase (short-subunit alcohol dehydrogenase family)